MKSLKFALSISLLLGTVALILPLLTVGDGVRRAIGWTLGLTLAIELFAIVLQAARGEPSHFNTSTPFDTAVWRIMLLAVLAALVALIGLAVIATIRPLDCDALLATAIRIGLWLLLLVAVSGFAMGGRGSHAVGAGDLRVPHFFALHSLQALPICALVVLRLPLGERTRWAILLGFAAAWTAICVVTLAQALAGRSLLHSPP